MSSKSSVTVTLFRLSRQRIPSRWSSDSKGPMTKWAELVTRHKKLVTTGRAYSRCLLAMSEADVTQSITQSGTAGRCVAYTGALLRRACRDDVFIPSLWHDAILQITSSSAVAKRSRGVSCLSVVIYSFNSTKRRVESFIVSYVGYRFITACS